MKRASLVIGLCSTLLLCASCFDEQADNLSPYDTHTIFVYMGGDNSLSAEVQQKIDALSAAWNSPSDHLLVYRDARDAEVPCLLQLTRDADGSSRIDTLRKYTGTNSAEGRSLGAAITDAYFRYPTEHFGIIVFSHGSGWLPARTFVTPRSVITDGTDEMNLIDFADALPNGVCRYILFESCLMAGLEVAYELRGKTDYVLASSTEILSPGFTPLYDKILPHLTKAQPELSQVAQLYFDHYNAQQGDNRSATVSVIKTSELTPVKKLLATAEKRVEHWEWVERDKVQYFDRRRAGTHLFYDAAGYMEQIGSPEEIAAFAAVLDKAVVYKAATAQFMPSDGGFDITQHSGLTLYIPDAKFPYLNEQRKKLKLFN